MLLAHYSMCSAGAMQVWLLAALHAIHVRHARLLRCLLQRRLRITEDENVDPLSPIPV